MATLLELGSLFGNGELRTKIEVAIVIAAEAIRVEDVGTGNHANRLIWAKAAFMEPRLMRDPMLKALLAANADQSVEAITSVTDSALQALVNAAVDVFANGS